MSIKQKLIIIAATVGLAMAGAVGVAAASSNAGGCAGFPDVAQDSQFCADITWMQSNGVAEGYADGHYGPTNPTSRQAMAAFMHRFAKTVTDGAAGQRGATGPAGTNGTDGAAGQRGATGPAGTNGTDGASGRFITNRTTTGVPAGGTATWTTSCNDSSSHLAGGVAIGGGFTFNETNADKMVIIASAPTGNADEWATTVHNNDTRGRSYLSWVVCMAAPAGN